MRRALWLLLGALALPASALAQDGAQLPPGHPPLAPQQGPGVEAGPAQPPPGHPPVAADRGTPPAQGQPSSQGAPGALPAGHPPVPGGQGAPSGSEGGAPSGPPPELPPGHPPMQVGQTDVRRILSPAQVASAQPSDEVPAGTIRVTVVDAEGQPVAGAPVDVGVLAQGGDRRRHNAETDENGVASFEGLETGSAQAYRVNVPHEGATYSSNPFQLPTDRGYDVRITRLPVTRDDRFVFFHVFRVIAELRDDRLHVIHQTELTNAGRETYVFPREGVRASLPEKALAFQAQRVMTDQRIEESDGGYVMRGSLPPGTVQLAWAYDLPIDGDTVEIPVDIPLRVFDLQVFSEAPEGLVMDVRGMPDPRRVDNDGQPIWVARTTRSPEQPPLDRITVTLSGIPGPGPVRWIAVALALLFVGTGVVLLVQRADDSEAAARARRRRRQEILDEIRELELEYESGEVGPEFRQSRRAELVRALAVLLYEEEAAKEKAASREAAAKPAGRPARSAR